MGDKIRQINTLQGGTRAMFAVEDGKKYRGLSQDMEPVFRHVKRMHEEMNGGEKRPSAQGWRYVASIPKAVLYDWLIKNHYTMPQYAINEDGAKDKFLKYIEGREFHKLKAGG